MLSILLPATINENQQIDHNDFLEWISARFVLLSLIISSVGNQHVDSPIGAFIGQIFGWASILFAMSIMLNFFKNKTFIWFLFLCLILTRITRIAAGDVIIFEGLYIGFLAAFFCLASAALILKYPDVILKNTRLICIISAPLMLIQIMGIAEWSHFLRTDDHGAGITQYPSMFALYGEIPLTFQTRPSGIFYANNQLALFLLFCCVLQIGENKTKYIYPSDIPVFLVVVLAMSKLVFVVVSFFLLRQIFFAEKPQKIRAIKLLTLIILFIGFYAILFPGFFAYNFSLQNYYLGIFLRFYDIVSAFSGGRTFGVMLENAAFGNTLFLPAGPQSGYTGIVSLPKPVLIVFSVLVLFLLYKNFLKLRQLSSYLRELSVMFLILPFAMLASTVFYTGPLFWFFSGGILMPLIVVNKLSSLE